VLGDLLTPDSPELFSLALVFLSYLDPDGIHLGLEILFANLGSLGSHVDQVGVESVSNMRASFSRRLDQEPSSEHISDRGGSRENDITELLDGSELIEGGGVEELHDDLVNQVSAEVTSHNLILEVGHQARVLVVGINYVYVKTLAVLSTGHRKCNTSDV